MSKPKRVLEAVPDHTEPIGPALPATREERTVYGDEIIAAGKTPPWGVKEKPATILGAQIAARAARAMATLASSAAVLAEIEQKRADAAQAVEVAQKELEAIGVDSFSQLAGLQHGRQYAVCADPRCEKVDPHSWQAEADWRCYEHRLPAPKPAVLEAMPAPKDVPF